MFSANRRFAGEAVGEAVLSVRAGLKPGLRLLLDNTH